MPIIVLAEEDNNIHAKLFKECVKYFFFFQNTSQGLPWWYAGSESTCQFRGPRFDSWSGRIPRAAKPAGCNYGACALESVRHNYRSSCTQSLCSATREATAMRSLCTATSLATREGPGISEVPEQPKVINKVKHVKMHPKKKKKPTTCGEDGQKKMKYYEWC